MAVVDGPRRLTRQGQERKQELLEHAARLFSERGYADTRVIDIVRAAGVAKGLFYWYFDNKEAVFRELVETMRQRLRVDQAKAIDPTADPLTRIRQGSEASIIFMAEQNRLYNMFDLESLEPNLTRLLRRGGDVHAEDTAKHIKAAIDAGLVRDDDPLLLAWAVVGAVAQFSHLHRTGRIKLPIEEVAAFAGRWVVRALAATSEIAGQSESGGLALAGF